MKEMLNYLYLGGAIVLIGGFIWMLLSMLKDVIKGKKNHVANLKEHEIIKQQVKLADGKIVDLEIRVKVLEGK